MIVNKGILIAIPERWDECCFALPALRALANTGLAGGIFVHERFSDLMGGFLNLPQVIYTDRCRTSKLVREVRGFWETSLSWDEGIAAKVFYKAHVPTRIGNRDNIPLKWLTHPLEAAEGAVEHRVKKYIKSCEELGISVANPEFFRSHSHAASCIPKTVLLSPDSDYGLSHEWPLERWHELGAALQEKGFIITVHASEGGRELGKKLSATLKTGNISPSSHELGRWYPHLAEYETTVSVDGSLPHLAALAGSRCVTIFGPNDPHWKRPLGKLNRVVQFRVECAPCLSAKCLLDGRCLNEVTVERVLSAIL